MSVKGNRGRSQRRGEGAKQDRRDKVEERRPEVEARKAQRVVEANRAAASYAESRRREAFGK